MTRNRLILLIAIILLWLVLAGGAAWWYLMGPNEMSAAEMVPGDTLVLAEIPNATTLLTGYDSSKLKTLMDDPQVKPIIDYVQKQIGDKGMDVINAFLPNLSGQSFIALTHLDPDKPMDTGFIAAMHPKPGLGNFDDFVTKVKTNWPDFGKDSTFGKDTIDGVDYQWIKDAKGPEEICVAQYRGWIVTTWGVAPLQDWIERIQKKSATPSLALSDDYKKSLARVGKTPMTFLYVNSQPFITMFVNLMAKQAATAGTADFFQKKLATMGGFAIGTSFENGEIVDRMSVLVPRGTGFTAAGTTPCPFETLKFTGPTTLLYTATVVNWPQYWKDIQEQIGATPQGASQIQSIQMMSKLMGIDVQHNIVDALGANSEMSIQMEWNPDSIYPEVGLFLKLDKPDDFQPVLKLIIDGIRKSTATTAVVNEMKDPSGQNFASLKFVQANPVTPTITENGPYLAMFISENQAVRSYNRKDLDSLTHNDDFTREVGGQYTGATQLIFLDTPKLLSHAYTIITPYLSLAPMFSPPLAAFMKGKTLPDNLDWLAPIDAWSSYSNVDDDGYTTYSVSGIGNQGLTVGGVGVAALMAIGYQERTAFQTTNTNPQNQPGGPMAPPSPDDTTTPPPTPAPDTTTPPPTPAPATPPAPAPDTTTPPAAPPAPAPDTTTPPPAAPAPATTPPPPPT